LMGVNLGNPKRPEKTIKKLSTFTIKARSRVERVPAAIN
jgi:hypothetical protein